jgi:multimeric flavodoxin WrbA
MKAVAFNGSPHSGGAVANGISVMAAELAKEGVETETIHVGAKAVRGCTACGECHRLGQGCAIKDDIVNEAREKAQAADAIILGSPVYYGGVAGTFKCFLDRLFFSGPKLAYKIGGIVVTVRRTGGIAVFHQLNNYFNLAQMITAPSIYWDVAHGTGAEEARQDLEGMQTLEVQARNMAWLLKALAAGSREAPPPAPPERRMWTNFIR